MNRHYAVPAALRKVPIGEGFMAARARGCPQRAGAGGRGIGEGGRVGGGRTRAGTNSLPAERFRGLAELYTQTTSLTAALKELGVPAYTRKVTRLSARLPSEVEARHLGQAAARPVLQAEAVNVDPDGRPLQYSITQFCGDRVEL